MQSASDSGVRIYQQTGKTRLYWESERCQQKEQAIVERAEERFQQALAQLWAGLSTPHTTKRLERSGCGSGACGRSTPRRHHITRSACKPTRRVLRPSS